MGKRNLWEKIFVYQKKKKSNFCQNFLKDTSAIQL